MGIPERARGGFAEEVGRSVDEGLGPFRPALIAAEPVIGTYRMALDDAGIGKDRHQPFEILVPAGEYAGCFGDHIFRAQLERRHFRRQT